MGRANMRIHFITGAAKYNQYLPPSLGTLPHKPYFISEPAVSEWRKVEWGVGNFS